MDNQYKTQFFFYISEKKQNKTYFCIKTIETFMLAMLFLLDILNFQLENSVNIMFQMREESTLTFNITKFILIIIHLLFSISVLSLEKVSHSNAFKFFLKKKKR